MKRCTKFIVALITATLATMGVASPSSAADATASVLGASVTFRHSTDSFRICDTSGDGLEVYAEYKYIRVDGTLQHDRERVTNGGCATYDHNFGEDRVVTFKACTDAPSPIPDACSTWKATVTSASNGPVAATGASWTRWIAYGDKFENCDIAEDGLLSYVEYRYVRINGTTQADSHYNPGNAGDCWTWDHNFGEGRTVRFRSCVDSPSVLPDACSAWREATV